MENKKVNLDEPTHKKVKDLAEKEGHLFGRLLSKLVNIGLKHKVELKK